VLIGGGECCMGVFNDVGLFILWILWVLGCVDFI